MQIFHCLEVPTFICIQYTQIFLMWQKSIAVEMCFTYSEDSCLEAGRCALFPVQNDTILFIPRFSLLFLEIVGCSLLSCYSLSHFSGPVSPLWCFPIIICLDNTSLTAVQLVHKFRKRKYPLDHDVHQRVHRGSWLANPLSIRLTTPLAVFHTHCNS